MTVAYDSISLNIKKTTSKQIAIGNIQNDKFNLSYKYIKQNMQLDKKITA